MTTGPVQIEQADAEPASNAYDAVRADGSIQYSPVEVERQPEPPTWLQDLFKAIAEFFEPIGKMFGGSWPIVKWVLIAGAAACFLFILWKLLRPVLDLRPGASKQYDQWIPEQDEAIALLEEVDQLAANGQYDEATHLLLKRSVGQISDARPNLVDPSSTARELAVLPALSDTARTAFATIAERVEHSLFALNTLDAEDWQTARDAYAQFALQHLTDETA